ncbi:hypothetical protein [Bradyrhizobium sp. USDA 10063]
MSFATNTVELCMLFTHILGHGFVRESSPAFSAQCDRAQCHLSRFREAQRHQAYQ